MYKTDTKTEKQKQLFQRMTPEVLSAYCAQHPRYSLPAGVRNQRIKDALDSMAYCAQQYLSSRVMCILSVYMQETFCDKAVNVSPRMLNTLYAPVLEHPTFEKEPLRQAIDEFLGFAKTPMTKERKNCIRQFAKEIMPSEPYMPSRPATAFEKGMDAYRQRTSLFPHTKSY